jgi:hypothetical protein
MNRFLLQVHLGTCAHVAALTHILASFVFCHSDVLSHVQMSFRAASQIKVIFLPYDVKKFARFASGEAAS